MKKEIQILILCLILKNSIQFRKIGFTELETGFDFILNPHAKVCEGRRSIIISDKPVYKKGETIYITEYHYNIKTKKPLSNCKYNGLTAPGSIYDVDDKWIKLLEKDFKENEINDFSALTFKTQIDDTFKGGVYKVKSGDDVVKFFVLQFDNRKFGVTTDWNVETIKVNDFIKGRLKLKTFTKEFSSFKKVSFSYDIVNGDGTTLKEVNDLVMDKDFLDFNFLVPSTFKDIIIVNINFNLDGVNVNYKKEFSEAVYDEIVIDFNISTGKIVKGSLNKFYFAAFRSEKRIFSLQIKNAFVYSKTGNRSKKVLGNIISDEEGRGKFEFFIDNFNQFEYIQYFLKVKYDVLTKKNI